MESQWMLWKVNGCYEKPLVAVEVNGSLRKSPFVMKVYGFYESNWLY
jgi:hypothetical protein